ncbi:ATP-binding cassette domain-containing protein [Alteromonas sp. A079]|uniref:ATP-binding cassette domain-containing protein n=1 Tax=Alteromonas sp. A079 TaxID=3410268 RepID=UPI003B9E7094
MKKEKSACRQTLTQWASEIDKAHQLGMRVSLLQLTLVKCLSLFSLIIGFYFFSLVVHEWIVNKTAAGVSVSVYLAISLAISWALQGAFNYLSTCYKMTLLTALERALQQTFAARQHALIRQHSTFYWQAVWLTQLQALADWACEYRVQQTVAAIVPLLVLTVILYINAVIGIGLLVTLPVVPLFMIIVGKGAATLHKKHFVALERLGGMFTDRLTALPMLANYRAHVAQTSLLSQASDNLNQRTMNVVGVAFLSNSVLDFFATLSVALVAVFIGFTLLGEISIGPSITLHEGLWVLLTVPLLLSEMKKLGQVYHQKAQGESAQEALTPLFSKPGHSFTPTLPSVMSRDNESASMVFTGWHAASFEVPGLLRCEAMRIAPNDRILLSGASGSGKTVLLEALSQQREASHSLHCNTVWLTQTPVILPSSVRDNLCLDDSYCDKVLTDTLHRVELGDWLAALPHGLDTKMTDYPALSGGEAQRLSLARALLRDADIWLLDEPTAHLPDSQHHRLSSLIYSLTRKKTIIWASHKALPAHWFSHFWTIENKEVLV